MKLLFVMALILAGMVIGAYTHEGDIQRECSTTGKATLSAWRGDFKCDQQ